MLTEAGLGRTACDMFIRPASGGSKLDACLIKWYIWPIQNNSDTRIPQRYSTLTCEDVVYADDQKG